MAAFRRVALLPTIATLFISYAGAPPVHAQDAPTQPDPPVAEAEAETPPAPAVLPPVTPIPPVVPDASPEAVELLAFLYDISGKHTLTGQHCHPLAGDTRLASSEKQLGHYPALFGQDFGFSHPGTWDGINFRQRVVDDAIRRHADGFVITLMWHAVPPHLDEPVHFNESIISDFTDDQWQQLLTPGTELHDRWQSQVDVVAWHLKQLRDANVPVLWRPYHEMNGNWFWWGKPTGDRYQQLYRMMFDRFTHFHKLNNLLWVYNPSAVNPDGELSPYPQHYPGHDVVDVLAVDVYSQGYNQQAYETLVQVADGRPIALGEVGHPPSPETLAAQPRWTWFMWWKDPDVPWEQRESAKKTYNAEQTLNLDGLPWVKHKPTQHHPMIR